MIDLYLTFASSFSSTNELYLAETYFDDSRNDPSDVDFEVSLQPMFAFPSAGDTEAFVSAIPLWHLNQYSFGVVPGENGGGPDPAGYVSDLRSL